MSARVLLACAAILSLGMSTARGVELSATTSATAHDADHASAAPEVSPAEWLQGPMVADRERPSGDERSSSPSLVTGERGGASWYGRHFHGRRTANGERYDQEEMTAAHKTLPFGTVVRVRSVVDGREVDVRINDRGPFVSGRVIDLSHAAARALGMLQAGVKQVTLLLPPGLRRAESPAAKRARQQSGMSSTTASGSGTRPPLSARGQ